MRDERGEEPARTISVLASRAMRVAVLVSLLAVAGCSQSKSKSSEETAAPPPGKKIGIDPDRWTCDVLTTPAIMSEAMGAPTRQADNNVSMPPGVARPCDYLVEVTPGVVEPWRYDLDCRDSALKTAEILFGQFEKDSADLVAAFADASAGKPIIDDAGVALPAPGAAFEVPVGRKGLDHHGQGILFVDDDAPCYVRVVGKDAARRLVLAKLVAQKLTPATAPMRPRYVDVKP